MNYKYQAHPFHLVEPSPWPFTASFALLILTTASVLSFHGWNSSIALTIGFLSVLITMALWWRDCIRESSYQGYHTQLVQKGITIGFILFIISEVFFFISIFWAYFHSSLVPTVELGSLWPPKGIEALNPWEIPLLNTILLLSSGASVTWAHHSIIGGDIKSCIKGLILTLILAVLFTLLQGFEYYNAPFTIADGIYGSCFYFGTGFHGLHVIIGTIFLFVCLIRVKNYQFTNSHHAGFEFAIFYWHFVDVVWLFLFISIYCWGY